MDASCSCVVEANKFVTLRCGALVLAQGGVTYNGMVSNSLEGRMRPLRSILLAATAILVPVAVTAQNNPIPEPTTENMAQISTHMGEMAAEMTEVGTLNTLRFEPWQLLDEMFLRDDVVFLMRHGPTDWSKLDIKDVAPTDCDNQRVMSPEGMEDMRSMGTILAANGILPSQIVVSEWCRNQQTLASLQEGFARVDVRIPDAIPVDVDPDLNLLLALQGAPNVTGLRELVEDWEGSEGRGPLLLISHFTNIEELTQFTVYEGEILVIDPKRDNRVLGYLRLRTASPDVGHFSVN